MIQLKEGVQLKVLRYEMYGVWDKIEAVFNMQGYPCIMTSGTEGHPEDDPHTKGMAHDFRSKHIPAPGERQIVRDELQRILGPLYFVLWENEGLDTEHLHIQLRKDLWRSLI